MLLIAPLDAATDGWSSNPYRPVLEVRVTKFPSAAFQSISSFTGAPSKEITTSLFDRLGIGTIAGRLDVLLKSISPQHACHEVYAFRAVTMKAAILAFINRPAPFYKAIVSISAAQPPDFQARVLDCHCFRRCDEFHPAETILVRPARPP